MQVIRRMLTDFWSLSRAADDYINGFKNYLLLRLQNVPFHVAECLPNMKNNYQRTLVLA